MHFSMPISRSTPLSQPYPIPAPRSTLRNHLARPSHQTPPSSHNLPPATRGSRAGQVRTRVYINPTLLCIQGLISVGLFPGCAVMVYQMYACGQVDSESVYRFLEGLGGFLVDVSLCAVLGVWGGALGVLGVFTFLKPVIPVGRVGRADMDASVEWRVLFFSPCFSRTL